MKGIIQMKKLLLCFSFIIFGLLIFTAQKFEDNPRWDGPALRVWVPGGDYTPILPVYREMIQSTTVRVVRTPYEIFLVNPNIRPFPHTATQSEVEAYTNPAVQNKTFAGWNSYSPSFYGTGFALTTNSGANWTGNYQLPGIAVNGGDPSVTINSSGVLFMNALGSSYTTVVTSKSTDNGVTWSAYTTVASSSSEDKNHITIDDVPTSPYYNFLYCSWTDFTGSYPAKFARSTDANATWVNLQSVTTPISGHFSQGVNLHTGPNGEVYFVCATNISGSPYTEDYIGFARSTNGGVNFAYVNEQAIDVNGIRGNLKTTNIRVNSFPWMAVDKSGGPRNGYIYVVWTQRNLSPAGSDPDICLSRSTNSGTNWSTPIRVNDDPLNNGRDQYFPNVNVDGYGGVNIVFYDSRNPSINDSTEVYLARSIDGGVTFTNSLLSDHRFKPKPISGLAGGYQGDYIGITSGNNKIWPFWADDYSGIYQVWTTSVDLGPSIAHTPLGNTENLAGPYVVNCVITPAGSTIDPTKTRLLWSRNNPVITDSVLMTNTSGNNWTANIPGNGNPATYRYYLKTADLLNRYATAPAGAPANLYSFMATPDTTKPVIIHTPITDMPRLNWPATVNATVTDNIGVDSVWVTWYKNTPSTGLKRFNLANTGGNAWSNPFNSDTSQVAYNDSIFYRVVARDISSNHNKDSTALYHFKLLAVATSCIGTGTTAVGYPFYTYYMDSRTDMLYLASEILAGGGAPGSISRIGFNVTTVSSQAMNGFNIKMQHTSASTISSFTSSGWTVCYTGTYTIPGTGWQYIDLQTPFYWNGTGNLLVEICFNNSSYTTNTSVNSTASTGTCYHAHQDLPSGDGCVDITSGSLQTTRPNVCLSINLLVGSRNVQIGVPTVYLLAQNYPNPFNPSTSIKYSIPKQSMVKLVVYDVVGREVEILVNKIVQPGNYEATFDASNLASGVYFYRIEAGSFVDVKKMVVLK
jgi:hypothetical protein